MRNLIFWSSNGYSELEDTKRIPARNKRKVKESIPKCKADMDWVRTWENKENLLPLPDKVYLEIKSMKKIEFDLLEWENTLIFVSKKLLEFLQKHGFNSGYDTCPVLIVNTKGDLLTQEAFYLIRIFKETTQAHKDLIVAENPTPTTFEGSPFYSIQPFANVYTHSEQKIFTPNISYHPALMFSEDLFDELKANFKDPRLYTATDWVNSIKKSSESIGF